MGIAGITGSTSGIAYGAGPAYSSPMLAAGTDATGSRSADRSDTPQSPSLSTMTGVIASLVAVTGGAAYLARRMRHVGPVPKPTAKNPTSEAAAPKAAPTAAAPGAAPSVAAPEAAPTGVAPGAAAPIVAVPEAASTAAVPEGGAPTASLSEAASTAAAAEAVPTVVAPEAARTAAAVPETTPTIAPPVHPGPVVPPPQDRPVEPAPSAAEPFAFCAANAAGPGVSVASGPLPTVGFYPPWPPRMPLAEAG